MPKLRTLLGRRSLLTPLAVAGAVMMGQGQAGFAADPPRLLQVVQGTAELKPVAAAEPTAPRSSRRFPAGTTPPTDTATTVQSVATQTADDRRPETLQLETPQLAAPEIVAPQLAAPQLAAPQAAAQHLPAAASASQPTDGKPADDAPTDETPAAGKPAAAPADGEPSHTKIDPLVGSGAIEPAPSSDGWVIRGAMVGPLPSPRATGSAAARPLQTTSQPNGLGSQRALGNPAQRPAVTAGEPLPQTAEPLPQTAVEPMQKAVEPMQTAAEPMQTVADADASWRERGTLSAAPSLAAAPEQPAQPRYARAASPVTAEPAARHSERQAAPLQLRDPAPLRTGTLADLESAGQEEQLSADAADADSADPDLGAELPEQEDAAALSHLPEQQDDAELQAAKQRRAATKERSVAPVISADVLRLRASLEQCLTYYYQRPELAHERSPWGMLHSVMVYGVDTQIIVGRKQYNAIAWMAGNNPCRNQRILAESRQGIYAREGVGLQGHQGQLLAVFGLVGVPDNYPLYVNRRRYSMQDLIRQEQLQCRDGEELTFTLIAMAHYVDTDARWRAADGQMWDFQRLLREELAQSVVGAACGGTHRLMGLSHALRARREAGKPITGQWKRAEIFLDDFVEYAWRLQSPDGSMSTDWFEGRADNGDLDRKVQTTGHIVEWLLGVTPDAQLQDERLVRAIRFLSDSMLRGHNHEWQIGPKGHALRALMLYHQRVFDGPEPWRANAVAQRHSDGSR